MQSFNKKRFNSFRADANALGGFLNEPFEKIIPTLAPVSLPPVGGFATARSDAFNLDEIVSCASAHTRVSGREHANGSISILVAAVIEELNILEVVRAERIVAQVSIFIPERGPLKFSLAGTGFEGLTLAGRECTPALNRALHQPRGDNNIHGPSRTWQDIVQPARAQADDLVNWFRGRGEDAYQWAMARHGWMTTAAREQGEPVLCSLVDGFEGWEPTEGRGHIVDIPGFGRIILGELLVSRNSIQLVAIRAELGCPVQGQVGVNAVGGGGGGNDD